MKKITGFLLIAIRISIVLFNSCKKDVCEDCSTLTNPPPVAISGGSGCSLFRQMNSSSLPLVRGFNSESFLLDTRQMVLTK